MRGGTIFWGVLILIAVAAIVALCLRPSTVIGVSDKSLAYSVRQAAEGSETGRCEELDDDVRFLCTADVGEKPVAYAVEVDDYGCWEGKPRTGKRPLEGCITIMDLIRLDD